MKAREWGEVCKRMVALWPHADWEAYTGAGSLKVWGEDLSDQRAEHVAAAVEAYYRDKERFPPNSGQIRSKLAALMLDVPEWGQASKAIRRCAGFPSNRFEAGKGFTDERERELAKEHPLVQAFVTAVGWTEACRSGHEDRTAEAQVRDKWLGFVRREQREATYAGLPAPDGVPALARINRDAPRRLGEVVAGLLPKGDDQ